MPEFYKNSYKKNVYYALDDDGRIYIMTAANDQWKEVTGEINFNPSWVRINEDKAVKFFFDLFSKYKSLCQIEETHNGRQQKNKKIDICDLCWFKSQYSCEGIIGMDEYGKYYNIDSSDGRIFNVEPSEDIKNIWSNIPRIDAVKFQADYLYPEKVRKYIDLCINHKDKSGVKVTGTEFKFYYLLLDRIIAIDENNIIYECFADRMEPLSYKIDRNDLTYIKPGDVIKEFELVEKRRNKRNSSLKLQKESIGFNDIYAYISPNGVIGGVSKDNENDEYILSYATGHLQKVKKGEGFDRRWERCSSDKYYETSEPIQEKLKKLEEAENDYDPDWDLFEPFREVRIESLDLYWTKDSTLYGKAKNRDIYVLDKISGIFEKQYDYFETFKDDKHCKIYKAYDVKAEIMNKNEKIKNNDESEKNDVQFRQVPVNLEDLELFMEPPSILFDPKVVGIAKNGREYEISHYSGKIIPIEGESPIKDDWLVCPLGKAKEIQKSFEFSPELKDYIKRSAEKAYRDDGKIFGRDFRFYLSDIDLVYAIDENRNEYICCPNYMVMKDNCVDIMWGGLSQDEVLYYIKRY